MTNAEIADELVLGEGTVKTHVHHGFTKLGLHDRAAAVVLAHDHDLVRRQPPWPPPLRMPPWTYRMADPTRALVAAGRGARLW